MEQLKKNIEALEQEKRDLLQKLQSSEEDFKAVSKEKDSLKIFIEDLQAERDIMSSTVDSLYKSIEKTVAANLELQEHVRATAKSPKSCCEILQESKGASLAKAAQLSKSQKMVAPPTTEQSEKVKTLTAELALRMNEKEQLVIENKRLQTTLQEVMLDNSYHKKRVSDFWQTIFSLRMENDHLRRSLIGFTEKEVVNKLPVMEKKKDSITILALNLKSDLEVMKTVAAKGLAGLPLFQTATVLKLQMYYEQASDELYCVLTDIKHYFSEWYKESKDYYICISKVTTNLLDENLKQLKLLIEIQILKKAERYGAEFKQLDIPALRRKLDLFLEIISQDLSNLEEELLGIEAKARQLESSAKEAKQYVEKCSMSFSIEDFEKGLNNDIKRLRYTLELLKPKLKVLASARQEVVGKHISYFKEAEAVMKSCQERSERWQKELKALEAEMEATALHKLEEAKKLGENLSIIEKEMTAQLDEAAKREKEEIKGLMSKLAKTSLS
ncbi:centromere-associated protein E-like isoform 1-T3 [Liasis olivaceus]